MLTEHNYKNVGGAYLLCLDSIFKIKEIDKVIQEGDDLSNFQEALINVYKLIANVAEYYKELNFAKEASAFMLDQIEDINKIIEKRFKMSWKKFVDLHNARNCSCPPETHN